METTPHIEAFRSDLVNAAGMGGDQAVRLAEQLGTAVEPALRLRLLDVLSEAAMELNEQLPRGQVDVRVAGRDAVLAYVEAGEDDPPTPAAAEEEQAARITLRLPDSLKGRAEAAAAAEGVSLNTWLVKAIARSLDGDTRKATAPGRRLTGYARG